MFRFRAFSYQEENPAWQNRFRLRLPEEIFNLLPYVNPKPILVACLSETVVKHYI